MTCGLDHTLGPAEVSAENYDYPGRKSVRHGLHGRVALIPARLTGYGERWEGDRCVLWAEGIVHQATVFGEDLRLYRRIEADVGGARSVSSIASRTAASPRRRTCSSIT